MKTVVVGLSGGVDSAVSAYLLKKQGYRVIGIFMRNWNDESVLINAECHWEEDSKDALLIAEKLDIPFQTIDLSVAYKKRIVDYMFSEYKKGRTPNPDVLCNREVKFDLFLEIALDLGADFVGTGHYCQKKEVKQNEKKMFKLLKGQDNNKDQSYFLCQLNQFQLSKALFPIGELKKSAVREIAKKAGLPVWQKKDSQGLCFIGKVKLPTFLQQQLKLKKGDIVEIPSTFPWISQSKESNRWDFIAENGKKVGEHNGAHFYTIGQRKGLAVGGTGEPLFVLETNTKDNIVYVGRGISHPFLFKEKLWINKKDMHWLGGLEAKEVEQKKPLQAKIRYRQMDQICHLEKIIEGYWVHFQEKQRAVAPGQFCVFYQGKELLGSGVIQ